MRHTRMIDDERYNDDDFRPAETVLHVTQTIGRPDPVEKPAAPVSAPRRFGAAILKKILGGSVVVSSTTIDDKIAALHAEIATAEGQQRAADEKLARPGLLSDADHERVEAEAAAARRAVARAMDVIQGLEAEREVLAAAEAKAAFLKHVEAARTRAEAAAVRLQTEYEPAAKIIAGILADVRASQAEIQELVSQGREYGEAVEIEHPAAFRANPDADGRLYQQPADLLSEVSLPGLLWNDAPIVAMDFEAVNRARTFRMPR